MLGRPPPPRRALLAATLGAIYALILLLEPTGIALVVGTAWFLLSVGLLFMIPLAYHAYVFWTILWIVWRGVTDLRASPIDWTGVALDMLPPVAALALLLSSRYLERATPVR
jgi:hypothetical protein